jgi:hypothetical protein
MFLRFGRKAFNSFLCDIHGTPGDSWKAAQIELRGIEVGGSIYNRIEFFTETLIGPLVAQHVASTEEVHVTVQRPTEGIFRTGESILRALENGDIAPRS